MKLDVTRLFYNSEGEPLQTPTGKNLTLRFVCVEALHGGFPNEKIDASEHTRRWELGNCIATNDLLDVSSSEIDFLKMRISKTFTQSVVVGQALEMLKE